MSASGQLLESNTSNFENDDTISQVQLEEALETEENIIEEPEVQFPKGWRGRVERTRSNPRFVLAVGILAVFIDGLFYSIVIPILPLYIEELGVGQVGIGFLFAVFAVFSFAGAFILGPLSDRIGRRKPMIGGLAILFGSTLLFAFGKNYWVLLFARGLQGLSSAATWTSAMASVGDVYPPDQQGGPYSMILTVTGIGSMAGPVFGGIAMKIGGGRKEVPFLIILVFIFFDGVARFIMKEPLKSKRKGDEGTGMGLLLKDAKLMMACSVGGVLQILMGGIEATLPVYLQQAYDFKELGIGLFYGALLLVFSAASFVAGKLCDKYPHRRFDLMAAGIFGTAVSMVIGAAIPYRWPQVILFCLSGSFCSLGLTPQVPAVNEVIEQKYGGVYTGTGTAITNIFWSAGAISGPIAFSVLMDKLSFAAACYILCGVVAVFGLIFVTYIALNRKQAPSSILLADDETQDLQ